VLISAVGARPVRYSQGCSSSEGVQQIKQSTPASHLSGPSLACRHRLLTLNVSIGNESHKYSFLPLSAPTLNFAQRIIHTAENIRVSTNTSTTTIIQRLTATPDQDNFIKTDAFFFSFLWGLALPCCPLSATVHF